MKRKLNQAVMLLMCVAIFVALPAHASNTGWHVVERVQITAAGNLYLRPVGLGGWGGNDCPNAVYAYAAKATTEAFDNYVAMAIASKLNGTPIVAYGTCNSTGTYFEIDYLLMG